MYPEKVGIRTRWSFGKLKEVLELPNFIEVQRNSYRWFKNEGLKEVFQDISPIKDFTGNLILEFLDYTFGEEPKHSIKECKDRGATYAVPLKVKIRLINKETGEVKEQEIFMGDFPLMTEKGTFVINGAERVVVNQLIRSPGVYFAEQIDLSGKKLYTATIIPNRGAWLEFETDVNDQIYVRIDRTRKVPVATLVRALGFETNAIIRELFEDDKYIQEALNKDNTGSTDEALVEIYKRLRPGEPPTVESARSLLNSLFFDPRRYDLSNVGRYKLQKKLKHGILYFNHKSNRQTPYQRQGDTHGMSTASEYKNNFSSSEQSFIRELTPKDIIETIRYLLRLMHKKGQIDDIDHLGNRRLRSVGELLQNQFRIGLARMERVVKERMTIQDVDVITPQALVNIRPAVAAIKEFFGSSQLSQFMDQTNPLAELTHKRRMSTLGPGGLSRERAGFEVRDVHHSHYGRICPIETPEGPNIGLIGSLATYARLNEFGFIETAYRKVVNRKITDEVEYLTADDEEKYTIAQATADIDEKGYFVEEKVLARLGGEVIAVDPDSIDYMDVSPKQLFSAAASLIPFLEHDDANRALMGSNMQRQAVPLIYPEPPLVGTGMEKKIAHDSGQIVVARNAGKVIYVSADKITIEYKAEAKGKPIARDEYNLYKFRRSNQGTCINQRPIVFEGQEVKKGEVIADGPSTNSGELALGRDLLVAFMPWEGYNYEDAIVLSERLVKEDVLSSIHISKHEIEARTTKLGPEEITRDIPNVSDELLKNLDERGIIRLGAEVNPGDILVGKITPKGETELTAEEKLLRAIFGEKAREVRDSSLKVPHGESGKVIDIQISSKKKGNDLPPGVNELVRVFIAKKRKISVGDKLAGRHGNKGVISVILPEEDMPYTEDGTPVDIVLNPLGVPSRMNVGQILETHLGWAAHVGWKEADNPRFKEIRQENGQIFIATPIFDGANEEDIMEIFKKAGLPETGKVPLFDGKSGEKIASDITIGYIYILKLLHLVDDKIHARSTGPYSLVTQQPLGGKAQFGGQRFGEMEVWALEAYGAAHILQEMLTIKSDDVFGRVKTYESIVKGENIEKPGIPESFKVLVKEMQSLSLDVEVLSEEGKEMEIIGHEDEIMKTVKELGIDLQHDESLNFFAESDIKHEKHNDYAGDYSDDFNDDNNSVNPDEEPEADEEP